MPRQIQAINPKMFTHFAAITVGLTALIGLMADGERRDYHQEAADRADAAAEREWAGAASADAPDMIRKDDPNAGSGWGGDVQTFGAPSMGSPRSSRFTAGKPDAIDEETLARLGLTRAQFEALTPAEQMRLLEELEARGIPVGDAARRTGEEAILERSRQRSGVDVPSADAPR